MADHGQACLWREPLQYKHVEGHLSGPENQLSDLQLIRKSSCIFAHPESTAEQQTVVATRNVELQRLTDDRNRLATLDIDHGQWLGRFKSRPIYLQIGGHQLLRKIGNHQQ